MFKKVISGMAMLLLGGAVILGTAEPVQAARGGRGGGGRGGYHGGSYHGGGYRGGYRGYGGGYNRGYYGRGYGGWGYGGWGLGLGLGYPYWGWGGYGYYPSSSNYYSYPSYSSYYYPDSQYPVYSGVTTDDNAMQAGVAAHLTVDLPPNAELWFNGTRMKTMGPEREFDTPPLSAGQSYSYETRARWIQDGRPVTQTQQVVVTPGSRVTLHFPK